MRTLYWHTDDLRIDDNPALALAAKGTKLACVYVRDERFQQTDRFGNPRLGAHRKKAVASALRDLDKLQTAESASTYRRWEGYPCRCYCRK